MTGEKARNVLEEDEPGSVSPHKVEEAEGEAGAQPGESAPLAGDAEILAGEAAGPKNGTPPIPVVVRSDPIGPTFDPWPCHASTIVGDTDELTPDEPVLFVRREFAGDRSNASEVRDSGPSLSEDGRGVRVDLGEADGSPAGTFKPNVESADS